MRSVSKSGEALIEKSAPLSAYWWKWEDFQNGRMDESVFSFILLFSLF